MGWIVSPPKIHMFTSEWNCIWSQGLCRGNTGKMRSYFEPWSNMTIIQYELIIQHEKRLEHTCTEVHTEERRCEDTARRLPSTRKAGGLWRNQTCGHLYFGLLASRLWGINSWCLSHPACDILLWQPQQTNTDVLPNIMKSESCKRRSLKCCLIHPSSFRQIHL